MTALPIKNESEHTSALKEIERLWGAEHGTEDGNKLDALVDRVEHYEEQHFPIGS